MIDLWQIINSIIGVIIAGTGVWLWTKLKARIPDHRMQQFIAWAKTLGETALFMVVVLSVVVGVGYCSRYAGTPPPGLKIVRCNGRCDSPDVEKLIKRCHLEARRYGALKESTNIHVRAKAASEDFTRCLAIDHIQVTECADHEAGCVHFTEESNARPATP